MAPEAGHAGCSQRRLSVMDGGVCWPSQPGAKDFRQKTCLVGRNVQVAQLLSLAYVLCLGPSVFTFEAVPGTKRPSFSLSDTSMVFSFIFFILSHQEQELWGDSSQFLSLHQHRRLSSDLPDQETTVRVSFPFLASRHTGCLCPRISP